MDYKKVVMVIKGLRLYRDSLKKTIELNREEEKEMALTYLKMIGNTLFGLLKRKADFPEFMAKKMFDLSDKPARFLQESTSRKLKIIEDLMKIVIDLDKDILKKVLEEMGGKPKTEEEVMQLLEDLDPEKMGQA